jgi:hypothetical protein
MVLARMLPWESVVIGSVDPEQEVMLVVKQIVCPVLGAYPPPVTVISVPAAPMVGEMEMVGVVVVKLWDLIMVDPSRMLTNTCPVASMDTVGGEARFPDESVVIPCFQIEQGDDVNNPSHSQY